MLTFIAFIITIGIVVTIHEYGHFQMARWCGIKVLKFSIGFGKPLLSKTMGKDKTEFVLAAIPLGGYVKMLDEREFESEANEKHAYSEIELARAFNRQSVYKRIAVVLAGPLANIVLAVLVYWVLNMQGVTGVRPVIGHVIDGSLAAESNFVAGEEIQSVDNQAVSTWSDAGWLLVNAAVENQTVTVTTKNNENEIHEHILPLQGMGKDAAAHILQKVGLEVYRPDTDAIINQILPGGAAEKAGLKVGDNIISIDHHQVSGWNQVVRLIKHNPDTPLLFKIERENQQIDIKVKPALVEEDGMGIGKIGAGVKYDQNQLQALLITQRYSATKSLLLAVSKTWQTAAFSLKMMWYMVLGKTSWKGISGPVTIATYAGESAGLGLDAFMSFIALVSISIGILNLLPIPVLDGGHLMYYIAEILKGSAVSEQTMLMGQKVGMTILIMLMSVAIFNDINRIIAG